MTWRLVLQLYDRTQRILDIQDVRALRQALDRARRDPNVIGWRYWRLTDLPPVPACGHRPPAKFKAIYYNYTTSQCPSWGNDPSLQDHTGASSLLD